MQTLVDIAIAEDIGSGDVTSEACLEEGKQKQAVIIAREELVVCGIEVVADICSRHAKLNLDISMSDGDVARDGEQVLLLTGEVSEILTYERVILNFLQHLSGISTLTRKVSELVSAKGVLLLDTRKTTPGYRLLEKYAVRVGGGTNHREGLFDKFLIKNNHIDFSGRSVSDLITACRLYKPALEVEAEVRNLDELQNAITAQPDWILLDNFTPAEVREALKLVPEGIKVEVSGGLTPENVSDYLIEGVTAVSMGFLTHSARASDLSLRLL